MNEEIRQLAAELGISEDSARQIYERGQAAGRAQAGQPSGSRITRIRERAGDLQGRLSRDFYHEAQRENISFSALLERLDPSEQYNDWVDDPLAPGGRRLMDAFERQMMLAEIRTKPDVRNGIPASTVERFYTSNAPNSEILFPEFINRTIRAAQLEPGILDELITLRTLIDGNVYTSFRVTDLEGQNYRMQRLSEGAEPRRVKISGAEVTNRLHKFGVALQISYEAVRRMSLDLFAFHLAGIARQNDVDKAAVAIDVIVNGDGNPGTAATVFEVQSDLDATDAELEFKPLLAFLQKFRDPYAATTIIGRDGPILDLMTLNLGTSNTPLVTWLGSQGVTGVGSVNFPRPMWSNIRAFASDDAPADALVAIDRRYSLQMLQEIGADLTETDKIIAKQLNEVVITDVNGFAILDQNANKVLDLSN